MKFGRSHSPILSCAPTIPSQQRLDLERSLEYAKKKLNVGVNWRV